MNERLREIRIKYKISQKKMAEILKISQSQTSYLELNNANTTNEVIANFYKYFGAEETIYLISGERIKINANSEIEQLFNQLNSEYQAVAKYKIKELIKEQQQEENSKGKSSNCQNTDIKTS